jgi:hypothetical protein
VTSLSGTKPYFFKSLRMSFNAARLFLFAWTNIVEDLTLGIDGAQKIDHAAMTT